MTTTTVEFSSNTVGEEADEERFLDLSRDITRAFVDLYMVNDPDIESRSPEERQRGIASVREKASAAEVSEQVAKKLQRVGDQLDSRLKGKIKEAMHDLITEQSVWEIGYSQFAGACNGVLTSCQGHLRNGWEQMTVVYMTAGQLISELRYQRDDRGPREHQMEGYSGTFLSDSGLQDWAEKRGGIENMDQIVSDGDNAQVLFAGTEV